MIGQVTAVGNILVRNLLHEDLFPIEEEHVFNFVVIADDLPNVIVRAPQHDRLWNQVFAKLL